jgi:hypothetical protein
MPFDMLKADAAGGLMDGPDYHVNDVPISLECVVREALVEGASRFNSFDKGIIVAAQLDVPGWARVAELEDMMEEPGYG